MNEAVLAQVRIRGLPLECWLTLPFVIICFYVIFRWRKFGEDAFTWNHEYFKLACAIGATVWIAAFLATFLPEPWHIAVFWFIAFVLAVLGLSFWGNQALPGAAILALLIVAVGAGSMPFPQVIRNLLYGAPEPVRDDTPAGIPRRAFALNFPDGWHELSGKGLRTYSCQKPGSGVVQISFLPPSDPPISNGEAAEKLLSEMLGSIGMDLGQQNSLSHEECASGVMAFADHRSEQHGLMRFWLIPAEVSVFASYTDGHSPAAEPEIAEAHKTLKAGRFR